MQALSIAASLAVAAAMQPGDVERSAQALRVAFPGATTLPADHGGLAHASGLAVARTGADDELDARRFLAGVGGAFGIASDSDLQTRSIVSRPGSDGVATFRRLVEGLPVFGGDVSVGWRADGAVTVVNGSRALAVARRGAFAVDAEEARRAALAAAGGVPGASSVEPGWVEFGGALLPAYRVVHDAASPSGAYVSYVDGSTGALLHRVSRRHYLAPCPPVPAGGCGTDPDSGGPAPCICAFRVSPVDPPPTGGATDDPPELFGALGLVALLPGLPPAVLNGNRAIVYNCHGLNGVDNGGSADPALCKSQLQTHAAGGNFVVDPDSTQQDPNDAFAEQSAYFHIDAHSRFLDGLDPAFSATPGNDPIHGGIGLIDGLVNAYAGGQPFDNAFFQSGGGLAGTTGVMVYGQASLVDVSYDADIVYHELTHAAVDRTASFEELVDDFGTNRDPGALNEGTADTFSFTHVADALAQAGDDISSASCLSPYFGRELGIPCLRQAANAKTCRGNGPNDGRNPGRDGEVHDDGEIWTGFTWTLLEGAHAADPGGANGWRQAMASALFKALEASGPHTSFAAYAATVRQKVADGASARALPTDAVDFTDCVITQRDMNACDDRAVALFSGERAAPAVFGTSAEAAAIATVGQQYFIDVPCGATAMHVQTGDASGQGTVYVRHGQPVTFLQPTTLASPQFDWRIDGDKPDVLFTAGQPCGSCPCAGTRTVFGAGRWYFLAIGPLVDDTGAINVFQIGLSLEMAGGAEPPSRPPYLIDAAHNVCTWGGGAAVQLATPQTASLRPPVLTGCAEPTTAFQSTFCSSTPAVPQSGCGCRGGDAGWAALAALALRGLRRRRQG